MEPIQRLYRKDEMVTRSLHIDEDLYCKLQYLCDNIYDTSVSKLVNICVETMLLHKGKINFIRNHIRQIQYIVLYYLEKNFLMN